MRLISTIISWIFLPLFMPVLALLIVFYAPSSITYCFQEDCLYSLYPETKNGVLILFAILTIVAPGLSLLFLRTQGIINSIEMETSQERNIPIIIMFLYAIALFVFLWFKSPEGYFPKYLFSLPLSGILVTFTFFWLNRWDKVSIHAGSVGILVGFLLAYMIHHGNLPVWPLVLSLGISGIVISARLYLGKHTLRQVGVGWGVGLLITFITNILY